MKIIDDGVIKYDKSGFIRTVPLPIEDYLGLENWRKIFKKLGLISSYEPSGIGYGNISQRRDFRNLHPSSKPQFVITGTQTGQIQNLDGSYYTRVVEYDIDNFSITAMGPIDASSESLTHAAIYELNPSIRTVIHIHNETIWSQMIKHNADATSRFIPYGTQEMALSVKECLSRKTFDLFIRPGYYDGKSQGIFVMKGHHEGVVAYGPTLQSTGRLVLKMYKEYVDSRYPL